MSTDKEKLKAVNEAVAALKKNHGNEVIMRLNDEPQAVPVISTGCMSIDHALGVGGIPQGRIIEMFGPESSGKTTLALHVVAQAQAMGGICAFVDAEHALDPIYAQKLGVRLDELLVSQPDNGEQALEVVEGLVRSGGASVIVIDSVAALVPKAEIEGDMGEAQMGLQARLMSQAMRKLAGITSRTGTTLIFINQLRMKIGVVFGNPETTTGGNALKFYATVRIDIRRIQTIKTGDVAVGGRTRVKVVKNKVAPPFREAEFDILYGEGISLIGDLVDLGVTTGTIQKSGAWFSTKLNGEIVKLGQGRDAAKVTLQEQAPLRKHVETNVRTMLFGKQAA